MISLKFLVGNIDIFQMKPFGWLFISYRFVLQSETGCCLKSYNQPCLRFGIMHPLISLFLLLLRGKKCSQVIYCTKLETDRYRFFEANTDI